MIGKNSKDSVRTCKEVLFDFIWLEDRKASGEIEYWIISTSGDSSDKPSLGGGMMKRKDPQRPNLNYIGVPSIDE